MHLEKLILAIKQYLPVVENIEIISLLEDLFGNSFNNYDKLKKASLQLSLYNRALKYKYKLAVVELTDDGYYFHELEQLPKETLDDMLLLYKNSFIDQL